MFWVISVYFNIRNTLPNSGTFLLGHALYIFFSNGEILTMCWPAVDSRGAFDSVANCTGPADCFDVRGDVSVVEDPGADWCSGHM